MMCRVVKATDFEALSAAVDGWYRNFGIIAGGHDMNILCSAALDLFNHGVTRSEDLKTGLLELFPNVELVKQNAATSRSVH